jgi:hypothetical protein
MNLMHLNMQRERKIGLETIKTTYTSRNVDGRHHQDLDGVCSMSALDLSCTFSVSTIF